MSRRTLWDIVGLALVLCLPYVMTRIVEAL